MVEWERGLGRVAANSGCEGEEWFREGLEIWASGGEGFRTSGFEDEE